MKNSSSLATKTLLIVLIPIVVQLAMLIVVIHLHQQAEAQLSVISHSQRIIGLLNDTNRDVYELMYVLAKKNFQFSEISELADLKKIGARLDQDLVQLSQSAPEDPDVQLDVEHARELKRGAVKLLSEVIHSYSDPIGGEATRTRAKSGMNALLLDGMVNLLPRISEKQAKFVNLLPEANAKVRSEQERDILFVAIFELILSIGVAYLLTKSIVTRISRLHDNTYRIAANLPLNPPDAGTDEIADLDRTMQTLAKELQTVSGRESLLVQNASDAIITMDRAGKIMNVNQASASKFGYKASDLIGTRLAEYADPSSRSKVVEHLGALKETGEGELLEAQLRKQDGTILDVAISTSWFAPENCFFCIVHDVTPQLSAQRIKNEIVAMVTHDLKTPLSTVDYLLSDFEQNEAVNLAIGNDLEIARRNIKRISQLVIDFLDTEKIEANMYTLKVEIIDLEDIFRTTMEACKGLADQKMVQLRFNTSAKSLKGDFEAISRVLTNLVTNAINHSPEGSTVSVEAVDYANNVKISVSDNGPGLSPEVSAKIFDRFYQAPSKRTTGSSGLGLTICKLLVELGNGTIGVDSTPDSGSTFHFTVPSAARS